MSIHASILAWKMLWAEEPGWLRKGTQRVRRCWTSHAPHIVHLVHFDICMMMYIHLYSITQNSLTAQKMPCASPFHLLLPSPEPLATSDLFTVFIFLSSRMSYNQSHLVIVFSDWLLSLSNMLARFFHTFHPLIVKFLFLLNNIS